MSKQSFPEQYFEIMTKCHEDLKSLANSKQILNLFGQEVILTSEEVPEIVCHSVEEYENTIELNHKQSNTYLYLSTDVLFRCDCLPEDLDPEQFLLNLFSELKQITEQERKEVFKFFQINNQIKFLSGIYYTALESFYKNKYSGEYKLLRLKFPNQPFYPDFQFSIDEESYYESSRCY